MISWFKKARDPVSSATHFYGAIASLLTTFLMLFLAIYRKNTVDTVLGIVIFGISSILLYTASFIYHFYNKKNDKIENVLRKLDHSMIFVLIAGTYTPITITFVQKPNSYYFLAIIWSIAIAGILIKMIWINVPRLISTIFYLLMGWALIFDFSDFHNVPINCFILIAIGGIMYSVGAIIYIVKKPNLFKSFNFHDLFHIFVILGSIFCFLSIFIYIL